MIGKVAKVLYYINTQDNTKTNFMVIEHSRDLRSSRIISRLTEELESRGFGTKTICEDIVQDFVHNENAKVNCEMGEYEFGIDEVSVLPLAL